MTFCWKRNSFQHSIVFFFLIFLRFWLFLFRKCHLLKQETPLLPNNKKQCFKNRTGPVGPIGWTVERPQNRPGSMQVTVFDRIGDRTGEPAVELINRQSNRWSNWPVPIICFFKLKRCRFDAFYIETMSFYLEL